MQYTERRLPRSTAENRMLLPSACAASTRAPLIDAAGRGMSVCIQCPVGGVVFRGTEALTRLGADARFAVVAAFVAAVAGEDNEVHDP
ncbi:MAG: hypothetical protein WCD66_08835, partial [Rhodanobacteraceae bacterium]